MKSPAAHTSESPDIFSSSAEYATRFSGDIGEWFLEIQSKSVVELLNHTKGLNIADIGGGACAGNPGITKA
jgi:hypothetical protein